MAQIPTKAIYGLHTTMMQEVQSKARTNATNSLPDWAQEPTVTPKGKFQRIAQLMEKYQQEITELTKKLTNAHISSIAQEAKVVEEFYDNTAQMWTNMEDDEKIQQLDQKQEKITPDI
jgi:hypothetical protein